MLLTEILDEVPDPRGYNAVHDLTDVLFVALAAVLCGAVHCTEMAFFAKTRLELLRQFVPLERGAPSHDTFTRVLGAVDPRAFQAAFGRFMAAFGEQARADTRGQVAVDGKSLRRAYDKGRAHMPPLVVTAFDCETFMSLSQVVAQAGGEAQAAIAALQLLSLRGCIVSGDALHCHRSLTATVREGGGHYVLAIEGKTTHNVRDYALSQRLTPAEVLRAVRRHWAIENDLHWQLDVLMAEDQTRNRKHNGPANLAALRRLALNVLRSDPENIPLSHKRLKARWANEDLLKLMTHMR